MARPLDRSNSQAKRPKRRQFEPHGTVSARFLPVHSGDRAAHPYSTAAPSPFALGPFYSCIPADEVKILSSFYRPTPVGRTSRRERRPRRSTVYPQTPNWPRASKEDWPGIGAESSDNQKSLWFVHSTSQIVERNIVKIRYLNQLRKCRFTLIPFITSILTFTQIQEFCYLFLRIRSFIAALTQTLCKNRHKFAPSLDESLMT